MQGWLLCRVLALELLVVGTRAGKLTVKGPDIYDGDTRIKFKGIGLTCTEYMTKSGMDDAAKDEYHGHWAYNYCFGGPKKAGGPVELNEEPGNVLHFLKPDVKGGKFLTSPQVKKAKLQAPYDEVVNTGTVEMRPITRIPMTGSLYLYESKPEMYREIIDQMVEEFTGNGVAVILDLHWNCPDSTTLGNCAGAQSAPMTLKSYGRKQGTAAFWDAISKKYADNPLVFYELFNEPWVMEFPTWYGGNSQYLGMKAMYDVIRKNDPEGLIIVGGKDQYALDAQSGLAFYLQYKEDTGKHPTNIIWNIHPYVGFAQGLEHSLTSALRLALALQTIGPVIFTEFGQYCCGAGGDPCKGAGKQCPHAGHGNYFVHNVVNMAEQYDISWVGWAWRGSNVNNANRPCADGMAECMQPDMRDMDNKTGRTRLTDGSRGGADWETVWSKFIWPAGGSIVVEDAKAPGLNATAAQPQGFLPRPCIVENFNLGSVCGWNRKTKTSSLKPSDFTGQSIYTSILPGLPGKCEEQGCPGHQCETWTGPCHPGGAPAWMQYMQPAAGSQPASGAAGSNQPRGKRKPVRDTTTVERAVAKKDPLFPQDKGEDEEEDEEVDITTSVVARPMREELGTTTLAGDAQPADDEDEHVARVRVAKEESDLGAQDMPAQGGFCCFLGPNLCNKCPPAGRAVTSSTCSRSKADCEECTGRSSWCPSDAADDDENVAHVLRKNLLSEPVEAPTKAVTRWTRWPTLASAGLLLVAAIALLWRTDCTGRRWPPAFSAEPSEWGSRAPGLRDSRGLLEGEPLRPRDDQ